MNEKSILRKFLLRYCADDDLHTYCFDLNIDYSELNGSSKKIKVISLIEFLCQRSKIIDLKELLLRERSDVNWNEIKWGRVCNGSISNQSVLLVEIPGDISTINLEQVKQAFATAALCPIEQVRILSLMAGSVKIELLLPWQTSVNILVDHLKGNMILNAYNINAISLISMEGANLEGADLEGINFQGAKLSRVTLEGANLKVSNLKQIDFDYSSLRDANLEKRTSRVQIYPQVTLLEQNFSGLI